jgi:cyclophilin family peptidyl-prolyl cis-trans isomerase
MVLSLSTALIFILCSNGTVISADPPAKSGPATEEFKQLQKEFNAVNAELQILQLEYRKAPKDKRPELEKKWKQKFAEGEKLQAKYFLAAEKAYSEAPATDPKISELMLKIFDFAISRDDFENALRVGKLLIDNGHGKKRGFAMLGVAAVATGDFDAAEKYFAEAKKQGAFDKQPDEKDTQLQNAFLFSKTLPELRKKWEDEQKIREQEAKSGKLPRVRIKTEKGDIVVELFENEAPNTVANFIELAEKNYYDNVTFHRVLPGFMAQGGDPQGDGSGGPGYTIPDEVGPNHRNHFRGTLSMAKTARPDSGGSQFFLCFVPTPQLDGKHTVFGRVVEGIDVLAKIQRRDPENPNSADPDKILSMEVENKQHEYKAKKIGE